MRRTLGLAGIVGMLLALGWGDWAAEAAAAKGASRSGNRLMYLDSPCDPYYVGLETARFVTPQWVGQRGVEAVVVLSIDDLRDPAVFEKYLHPIFRRLKELTGRTPVSMMANTVNPNDPRLQPWFQQGVNLGAHTATHPCPCLQGNDFQKAKASFDTCVDALKTWLPEGNTVAFRLPCCDSMNSASPRFFAEIFNKTTPRGHYLQLDSSVFVLLTADDPALPRELVVDADGRPRLGKYCPANRKWINYVENYPYPYVIDRLCWELPVTVPGDWQGINLHKPANPQTVRDMQAAIDAVVIKQGVYTLCFHPYNWLKAEQVVEVIDHAAARHGSKVAFLQFHDVVERITRQALGGQPLRGLDGQDNGVRLLDLDADGFIDVVIGNAQLRQTRRWVPEKAQWVTADFPVELVRREGQGPPREAGVRFGILRPGGMASLLVRNEHTAGVWHFDGQSWVADPQGLAGLEAEGPVWTSRDARDQGVRLADLDGDGVCELLVGNPKQQAVFRWSEAQHAWCRLGWGLPPGTSIVDSQGRDAGARLVDLDGDNQLDFVFSDTRRCSVHRFVSIEKGWAQEVMAKEQGQPGALFPFVRADGTNNGAWFKRGYVWLQNEQTGGVELPSQAASRSFAELLGLASSAPR